MRACIRALRAYVVRVCACVRAYARACVRVCVYMCVCVCTRARALVYEYVRAFVREHSHCIYVSGCFYVREGFVSGRWVGGGSGGRSGGGGGTDRRRSGLSAERNLNFDSSPASLTSSNHISQILGVSA